MDEQNVVFCSVGPGGYTPVYDTASTQRSIAVNAGDNALYVGGGAMNLAFARVFQETDIDELDFQQMHFDAMQLATKEMKPVLLPDCAKYIPAMEFCYTRVCPEFATEDPSTGLSIVDIWKPTRVGTFKNENNCAMLYVVGPKGRRRDLTSFLRAVEQTGENLMRCATEANTILGKEAAREILRMCAISAGVYKHADATKVQVASALIKGMDRGFSIDVSPTKVHFSYDEDCFKKAWKLRK